MERRLRTLASAVALMAMAALVSRVAYAQGGATSSLSGVVVDTGGGVVPGATVVVKSNATGTTFEVVTNETGAFSVPALNPGLYTVTVSLGGFKTSVVENVRLLAAVPAEIKVILELGALEETITVMAFSELVQTRSTSITSTMTVDQIQDLPLPTRNAVNFATFLPGVNTTGVARDSNFQGLPDSAVAITYDGVNNNENFNKSTEGLFAMVTPRQDAIEAVTITTATPGSESGGHGAVTIRFVTRSGTDRFSGSLYEYYRDASLNENYYFNEIQGLPKNKVTINQYGGRAGGPIVIPGLYDGRGKAFFFVNYEEFRMPNDFSRTRYVLNPSSQSGVFRYTVTVGGQEVVREVNLYQLAAANGQTATPDPTVAAVLSQIRAATQTTGNVQQSPEPNVMWYYFQSPGQQPEKQPTARIDYNLSANHRLAGSTTWQSVDRNPDHLNGTDVRFPSMPNERRYLSYRRLASGSLRSAFGTNVVNEARGGIKWGPSYFGKPEWIGPDTFENQGGRALVLGNVGGSNALTNAHASLAPSARSAWSWNIDDTVNWQKASHALSFGGSYFDGYVWVTNQTMVPQINFGVDSSDPANAMFTTANFPGASTAQLTAARNLYAALTGRVTGIVADARIDEASGEYVLLGPRTQRLKQNEFGFFVHDVWRVNEHTTINAGVRWDVQSPIKPTNDIMSTSTFADLCGVSGVGSDGDCNVFKPGTLTGVLPTFVEYNAGEPGYKTDWNNFAPNVGVAWRPLVQGGWLRAILGEPEQATIRTGYSMAYNREGMALFTGVIGGNPGSTIPVNRNVTLGNLVYPGESWPLLLREENRLAMASFPRAPEYPIAATVANDISIFHPDIQVAYAHSLILSFQRDVTRDMAVDVRYVGTWGRNIWDQEDYNGNCTAANLALGTPCPNVNIIENGFLDEFRTAQANLQANIAAGRGNTFAYFGPGSGTSPLPIYLAYFSGVPTAQAGDAVRYTSSLFRDTNFISQLAVYNPLPYNHASDNSSYGLFGSSTRRANAVAAGLPVNFFIVNPDVDEALVYKSAAFTNYNALQIDLRRRMSKGLQFSANYQYAVGEESEFLGLREGRVPRVRLEVPRHAFKMSWNWSIPVGRGRRFGTNMNAWFDAVLGGWEFHGLGRVQSRSVDFGNVRLVGMTLDNLRDMYKVRYVTDAAGVTTVWMLPDDVILNTRRAFSVSATSPTGYSALGVPEGRYLAPTNGPNCIQLTAGDCADRQNLVINPIFSRFDFSLAKRFNLVGRTNFELRFDLMNVFNSVNFNPPGTMAGSSATMSQVTSGYTDMSNTFDPGGRLGQIALRFNW